MSGDVGSCRLKEVCDGALSMGCPMSLDFDELVDRPCISVDPVGDQLGTLFRVYVDRNVENRSSVFWVNFHSFLVQSS